MNTEPTGSVYAAVDAQYTTTRVLRPFTNFENVYQGESTVTPIAFPGDLDEDAGETGFDANLASGVTVPYGAKASLWIPSVVQDGAPSDTLIQYQYYLVWRLRNVRDYRVRRKAYHLPRQSFGANNQFVIPAAINILAYEESLGNAGADALQPLSKTQLIPESIIPRTIVGNFGGGTNLQAPFVPNGGRAALQQGVFPGTTNNQQIRYGVFQVDCLGDELLILCTRADTSNFWDFTDSSSEDYAFSQLYGKGGLSGTQPANRDVGIYLLTGTNP